MTEENQRSRDQENGVELVCDGHNISLNRFVQRLIKETIQGIVRSLGEIPENPTTIEIRIRQK
ncbi:MAG: hypothetical protein WBC70_05215 [Candidatus Aminicenantales bacterium]